MFKPLYLVSLIFIPTIATAKAADSPDRPNIVFLFADDQRADTIAAHGNPHIQTPNLDRPQGRPLLGESSRDSKQALASSKRLLFRCGPIPPAHASRSM